jgi:hypothetical protein
MNKKRKILTVAALAVFGAIIFLHYGYIGYRAPCTNCITPDHYGVVQSYAPGALYWGSPLIEDVRMPLFVLTVFYVGLFSIFGDKKG